MAASKTDIPNGTGAARSDAADGVVLRDAIGEAPTSIRRYIYGLCGDWDEAEELAQGALLKAWQKRASFDGHCEVRTWIFSIARNHWLDGLRRSRRGPIVETLTDVNSPTHDVSPHAAAARLELAEAVGRAVAKLPPAQREALALRESEGLTFAQIGELLGVPAATVKSRVRYALTKLADQLEPFKRDLER